MNRTRIKICGITSVDDARVASSLGADYLGVIFADSPRRVDIARARGIRSAVIDIPLVGVFRDQPLDVVVEIARDTDIDLIQLHGGETPAFCGQAQLLTGRPVIKAMAVDRTPDAHELAAYASTSYFLFDLPRREDATRDHIERVWSAASRSRGEGFRVFLAGALGPHNVGEAIRRTRAFAVDVCRGVERAPGIKDHDAMRRFFAEVHA